MASSRSDLSEHFDTLEYTNGLQSKTNREIENASRWSIEHNCEFIRIPQCSAICSTCVEHMHLQKKHTH